MNWKAKLLFGTSTIAARKSDEDYVKIKIASQFKQRAQRRLNPAVLRVRISAEEHSVPASKSLSLASRPQFQTQRRGNSAAAAAPSGMPLGQKVPLKSWQEDCLCSSG